MKGSAGRGAGKGPRGISGNAPGHHGSAQTTSKCCRASLTLMPRDQRLPSLSSPQRTPCSVVSTLCPPTHQLASWCAPVPLPLHARGKQGEPQLHIFGPVNHTGSELLVFHSILDWRVQSMVHPITLLLDSFYSVLVFPPYFCCLFCCTE